MATDGKFSFKLAGILIALLFMLSCSPDGDDDKPVPKPDAEQPTPSKQTPEPEKPPKPDNIDYSKPGTQGKTGVEPHEENRPSTDVNTDGWSDHGSLMGSSIMEMQFWDEVQKLETCPERPIYVWADQEQASTKQCADPAGYAPVCEGSEAAAWQRAVNAVRSCERVPGCRAQVTSSGQQWECRHTEEHRFEGNDGKEVVLPEKWEKTCWTQYKVVCLSL